MRKIKAILTDDEQSAQEVLETLLLKYCPNIDIVAVCSNLPDTIDAIKKHKPDVVFLDIEMPEYAGYEIVDYFDTIDFHIVFVTAYHQYAVKAFEISALDYLLKPIEIDRLKKTVERLTSKSNQNIDQDKYSMFRESLDYRQPQKMIIKVKGDQRVLDTSTIIAIEAQEAYSCIYTIDGDRFLVSKNLKYFQNLLEENLDFFRTHKSWIINRKKLVSFSKSKLEINMENEIKAKLSKYKAADFEVFLLK